MVLLEHLIAATVLVALRFPDDNHRVCVWSMTPEISVVAFSRR